MVVESEGVCYPSLRLGDDSETACRELSKKTGRKQCEEETYIWEARKKAQRAKPAPKEYGGKLPRPAEGFLRSEGVTKAVPDGSGGDSQSGNIGEGVEIGCAVAIADPEAFLPGSLKAGIDCTVHIWNAGHKSF